MFDPYLDTLRKKAKAEGDKYRHYEEAPESEKRAAWGQYERDRCYWLNLPWVPEDLEYKKISWAELVGEK